MAGYSGPETLYLKSFSDNRIRMPKRISRRFFEQRASLVAPKLLGKKLRTKECGAMITEVEAYEGSGDPASHAHRKTKRSKIMRETHARWYVYFIYGNHYCLNITCGKSSAGAILIREAVPVKGIEIMRKRRGKKGIESLCNGPGKLCQAFGVSKKWNGLKLGAGLWLEEPAKKERRFLDNCEMATLPRIGISKAKTRKWRFRARQTECDKHIK